MLKEIFEQTLSIQNAVRGRLNHEECTAQLGGLNLTPQELREIDRILITGCGTAMHAGMVGEYIMSRWRMCRWRSITRASSACAFAARSPHAGDRRQPERRDGGHARRIARGEAEGPSRARHLQQRGQHTRARDGRRRLYVCRPEVQRAATKSFTSQTVIFVLLGLLLGRMRYLSATQGREIIQAIEALPTRSPTSCARASRSAPSRRNIARRNRCSIRPANAIRRGARGRAEDEGNHYIHAEAIHRGAEARRHRTGRRKHAERFPLPKDGVYEKNINNLQQIKARKGPVIAVATRATRTSSTRPTTSSTSRRARVVTPILSVVTLQLFAYHMPSSSAANVDKPATWRSQLRCVKDWKGVCLLVSPHIR